MSHRLMIRSVLVAALALTATSGAVAGPYADDMAKCLVSSTTPEDRTLLMKWVFSALTLHPDLASLSVISDEQRDEMTKGAAELYQRLLLVSCRPATELALKNEGSKTIEYAFQILGEVAARGLFSDPHVGEGMSNLGKYFDQEKMKELISPSPE